MSLKFLAKSVRLKYFYSLCNSLLPLLIKLRYVILNCKYTN